MTAQLIKTLEREEVARVTEGKKIPDFAPGDTLRVATAGDYDQGLAKLNLSQRQVQVVVRRARPHQRTRSRGTPR